jgi:FixJ family two-component response regulator
MKAGAEDYITKPFNLERVAKSIQTAVNKQTAAGGTPQQVPQDPDISAIEAIALGVEARQDMLDVHFEIVVQQTLSIARRMGFSEKKLTQWTDNRRAQRTRQVKPVADSVIKLTQNEETRPEEEKGTD